jgi:hypothetical protein
MDIPDLRPLSFGELLDRTFTYFRRHFLLFIGIMAIPEAIIAAMNLLLQGFQRAAMPATAGAKVSGPSSAAVAGTIIGAIILFAAYFVLYAVAQGATTFAVSEVHLGHPVSARAAYGMMRGRYLRLFDLVLTIGIRVILAFVAIMFGFVMLGAAGGVLGSTIGRWASIAAMIVALLGFIAGSVLLARYFLRYACSVPSMLLENLKAAAAIRRSVALTKGHEGRIFVISLLMTMVAWTVTGLLHGPFLVAGFVMTLRSHTAPPFWLNAGSILAGGAGQVITGPLLMIALVLLYYDVRVRKEGLDLQLMMEALDAQSPVGTATGDYFLPVEPPLTEASLLGLISLTMFTLGLYWPIWFLQRRAGINKLHSEEKLSVWPSIVILLLVLLAVMANLDVGYEVPSIRHFEIYWTPAFSLAVGVIGVILMVFQAFKVQSIMEEHSRLHVAGPLAGSIAMLQEKSFLVLPTLFLGIFYLQYKINEMVEVWPQTQAGAGTEGVPALEGPVRE